MIALLDPDSSSIGMQEPDIMSAFATDSQAHAPLVSASSNSDSGDLLDFGNAFVPTMIEDRVALLKAKVRGLRAFVILRQGKLSDFICKRCHSLKAQTRQLRSDLDTARTQIENLRGQLKTAEAIQLKSITSQSGNRGDTEDDATIKQLRSVMR